MCKGALATECVTERVLLVLSAGSDDPGKGLQIARLLITRLLITRLLITRLWITRLLITRLLNTRLLNTISQAVVALGWEAETPSAAAPSPCCPPRLPPSSPLPLPPSLPRSLTSSLPPYLPNCLPPHLPCHHPCSPHYTHNQQAVVALGWLAEASWLQHLLAAFSPLLPSAAPVDVVVLLSALARRK